MHPDLHRYLDGDLPREELPPHLAAEAREWDALIGAASMLGGERAPSNLEHRVMSGLPTAPQRPLVRRALDWLVLPRPVQLRPISVALVGAAAVLVVFLLPRSAPVEPHLPDGAVAAAPAPEPLIYVQFVFASQEAGSVEVAGDFNDWQPSRSPLRDVNGDGVWIGTFAVPAGVHKYMFVVDGEEWVTDPRAERFVEDGFGMRNALLSVVPPARAS